MKILLHDVAGPRLQRQLADMATLGLAVDWVAPSDDARFYALLPDTEVIWHGLRWISADDVAQGGKLRLIQKIGVGVNTIDLDAAKAHGVAVCNMPGSNARAVAEMSLLLMLACLRRLPVLDRAVRAGEGWTLDPAFRESLGELAGRTVGLVGFGAIPQILAPALTALGAEVIYTATAPKPAATARFVALDDLLRQADIVSLHIPLTEATTGLIGAARLAEMKPGAILINTARGGLVDQAALTAALRSGQLSAAGLDVFADEPIPAGEPLLALDNVVLTPHLGWLSGGTLSRSLKIAVENCRRLAAGEPLLHRVV
ncbi:MAG TPA: 2-hydroxyacid dehydrogenase [Stellaceae bacterium]